MGGRKPEHDAEASTIAQHGVVATPVPVPVDDQTMPASRDSQPELDLAAGGTIGRYRLLERIGAGAMGVVWLAQDPQLDRKIAIMQANPMLSITITGHCDERGSDEYNLALGNRRALAAKEYMVNRGIAADRVTTASRGEEQPLDPANTEDAWAKNRRDEFAVAAGGQQLTAPGGM